MNSPGSGRENGLWAEQENSFEARSKVDRTLCFDSRPFTQRSFQQAAALEFGPVRYTVVNERH